MKNDVLFELGTEELPSGAVKPLAEALLANLLEALTKANVSYGDARCYATPRRLAVFIEGVQDRQPDQRVVKRGPSASLTREEQAVIGFARSCQVTVDELTVIKTDKGQWWAFESTVVGLDTVQLLPSLVNDAVDRLPIAKPMRWGSGSVQFARPVHWVVLLFGDQVVPATVLGVQSGRDSVGHRYHHPHTVSIPAPNMYESLLKKARVVADFTTRRQQIIEQVQSLAQQEGGVAVMPDSLIDEVTSIVEEPQALLVQFQSDFLSVPSEVLIAAMQMHQKCFALRSVDGKLLPKFITVANIQSTEPTRVIKGNEKVMHARLSDAAFFFEQDKKRSLSDYRPMTEQVVFQNQLGSLADKTRRMQVCMDELAPILGLNLKQAERAVWLSKCDLMTNMVGEFPELQGLMGYYYASLDQEEEEVAVALNEQYMPRFSADELPKTSLGRALSLVDRLDTLVGAFAIGQKPTGVKDPFKLRRHALAVIRLLLSQPEKINLSTLINQAKQGFAGMPVVNDLIDDELKHFILERLNSFYHGQGFSVDAIRAVRARQEDCLLDFHQRLLALVEFMKLPQAQVLSAACKRVNNILQQVNATEDEVEINPEWLIEDAEKTLVDTIVRIEVQIDPLYCACDYRQILTLLSSVHEEVDAFFENVMVMVDDMTIRNHRILMLRRLQALLQGVADISLLQLAS